MTEAQRHQLFESANAVFGGASAEIFMNLQPNVEWRNLATKDDVARLDFATKDDIARLDFATKDDIERLDFATRDDIARLDADIAALRADMKTETGRARIAAPEPIRHGAARQSGRAAGGRHAGGHARRAVSRAGFPPETAITLP